MAIFLAPSADLARSLVATGTILLTVEAEYGSYVAEGVICTAAHHQPSGPYAGRHVVPGGRPSPCNDPDVPVIDGSILVSHLDLDTFGGCLRAAGADLFDHEGFWRLAEHVDVRGPHRIGEVAADPADVRALRAFWAWSKANCARYPRDRVSDVTAEVVAAGEALRRILDGDEEMLSAGDALAASEKALDDRTFLRQDGPVIVRIAGAAPDFCNHLYRAGMAIACLNEETGSITVSLAEPAPGASCRAIVQALWGPEAGGHDGIAGSPRERRMTRKDLEVAVGAVRAALGE